MSTSSTEPPPPSQSPETDISTALASLSLTTELDSALLSHLNLLDKYMFHVECLTQLFRMAFFELVQANRDKSAQGGIRLGEQGYDQRMQALRRVYYIAAGMVDSRDVEPDNSQDVFMLRNFSKGEGDDGGGEEGLGDPLRWFGVLVPQSSRDAQRRFVNVLEESIEVANALVKLQASEKAILELRTRSGRHRRGGDREVEEPNTKTETKHDIESAEEHQQLQGSNEALKIEGKDVFPAENGHAEEKIRSEGLEEQEDINTRE